MEGYGRRWVNPHTQAQRASSDYPTHDMDALREHLELSLMLSTWALKRSLLP